MSKRKTRMGLLAAATATLGILITHPVGATTPHPRSLDAAASVPGPLVQNQGADAFFSQGVSLYQSGDVVGAEAAFRKAIELNPNMAEAHANLGSILANQNKLEEAIPQFETAVQLQPNLAILHYQLGVALYMHSRVPEAVTALTKARDLLKEQGKADDAAKIDQALQQMTGSR